MTGIKKILSVSSGRIIVKIADKLQFVALINLRLRLKFSVAKGSFNLRELSTTVD